LPGVQLLARERCLAAFSRIPTKRAGKNLTLLARPQRLFSQLLLFFANWRGTNAQLRGPDQA